MFMLPVPSWVHPAWLVCAGLLALVVARKVVGLRWTATTIAGAYLAYRAVMWVLLVGMGFPPSVLPFVLLVGAVLVDLAVTFRVPGWVAGPVVAGVVYGGGRRPGGPRPAAPVELVVGAAGRRRASACSGPASTCSPAAAGWPAGRRPSSPTPRRRAPA